MPSDGKHMRSETVASTAEAKRRKGTTTPPYSPPTSPRGDPITTVHPCAFVAKEDEEHAAKKTSEGLANARQYAQLMLMETDGPEVMACLKCCICASGYTTLTGEKMQIVKKSVLECFNWFLALAAMRTVNQHDTQTLLGKLFDCLEEVFLGAIHEKLQHGAEDMELPTSDKIRELAAAGATWAATMIARMHDKVDENLWLAMHAKLNGKMSAGDLPEHKKKLISASRQGTAIAARKLLPAYYALHILESSRVASMSVLRLHAVKKLQIYFEMELANAMSVECKKHLVYGDIKKTSAICKETICEAIAQDD